MESLICFVRSKDIGTPRLINIFGNSNTTVNRIKVNLSRDLGVVDISRLILIYRDQPLDDDNTVGELGVPTTACLLLLIQP